MHRRHDEHRRVTNQKVTKFYQNQHPFSVLIRPFKEEEKKIEMKGRLLTVVRA